MNSSPTILETIFNLPFIRSARTRRIILCIAALIMAILALWPRVYRAAAELLPDQGGAGLSSLLGSGLGGGGLLGSLVGGGDSIEVDIAVSRSEALLKEVALQLQREGLLKSRNIDRAVLQLRQGVDVEAIPGGIIDISTKDPDPLRAKAVISVYVDVLRRHLSEMKLGEIAKKRAVAQESLGHASDLLAQSQAAVDQFRAVHKLSAPETALGPALSLLTSLQANLQAEQTALQTMRHFETDENIQIQTANRRIAALQEQIVAAQANAEHASNGPSLGGLTGQITEYENLYRNERFAEVQYEIYKQYLAQIWAEEVGAALTIRVVDPPYIDPKRQFNVKGMAGLALTIILFMLSEVYISGKAQELK